MFNVTNDTFNAFLTFEGGLCSFVYTVALRAVVDWVPLLRLLSLLLTAVQTHGETGVPGWGEHPPVEEVHWVGVRPCLLLPLWPGLTGFLREELCVGDHCLWLQEPCEITHTPLTDIQGLSCEHQYHPALKSTNQYLLQWLIEVFLFQNRHDMLQIEPLHSLLEEKWHTFARPIFWLKFVIYVIYLIIFTVVAYLRKEGMVWLHPY